MSKSNVIPWKLKVADSSKGPPLTDRLNKQVLQVIRDLAKNMHEKVSPTEEFGLFINSPPSP